MRAEASDFDVTVDALTIGVISLLIAFAADELLLMSVAVPALIVVRMAGWSVGHPSRRERLVELAVLTICVGLGAFNDWSSVVRHAIYDYTVPTYFPDVTTVPIWMLLYWGLVLRFFVTLGTWHRVGLATPRNVVRLGSWRWESAGLKVLLLLVIVLATRQSIYRNFLDPVWSWAPFALAGVVYVALFGLDHREIRLAALVLVIGPVVEVLYIQVGGLHRYHLGWLLGVPLWIVLWWVLAVLIWCDLGQRLRLWLGARPRLDSRRATLDSGRPLVVEPRCCDVGFRVPK